MRQKTPGVSRPAIGVIAVLAGYLESQDGFQCGHEVNDKRARDPRLPLPLAAVSSCPATDTIPERENRTSERTAKGADT
jgi:hypothetical protein